MSYFHAARFPRMAGMLSHEILRIAVLLGIAVFLLDWTTKDWALLHASDATTALAGLNLGVARNDGFAFSSGAGAVPVWTIVAVRLAVLAVLVAFAFRAAADSYRCACGMALLIGGGAGNAADLLFRSGAVVDFISAGPFVFTLAGEAHYAHFVFNLADVFIFAGLVLSAPLIRRLGLRTQRRLATFEERLLQGR